MVYNLNGILLVYIVKRLTEVRYNIGGLFSMCIIFISKHNHEGLSRSLIRRYLCGIFFSLFIQMARDIVNFTYCRRSMNV